MTPLIWLFTWLLQAHSAICDLPAPVNVTLNSHHFDHILSWAPGLGTPSEAHYNVTINSLRRGQKGYRDVAGCAHIRSPLVCNLTDEFLDIHDTYYWKVFAVLGNESSPPAGYNGFKPIRETDLDPPVVTVSVCGSWLCANLMPPVEKLRDFYDKLHYHLKINRSHSSNIYTFEKDSQSLKRVNLTEFVSNTKYCVSVRITGKGEPQTASSNYSQPQCVFTPANSSAEQWISVILVLFLLMVLSVVLLFRTGFIYLKQPLPQVLSSIRHYGVLFPEPGCTESLSSVQLVPLDGRTNVLSDDEDTSEAESEQVYERLRAIATSDISSSCSSSRSSALVCADPNDRPASSIPSLSTDPQSPVETQPGHPGSPLLGAHRHPPLGPHFSATASLSHSLFGFSPTCRLPELPHGGSLAPDLRFSLSLEGNPWKVESLQPMEEEEEGSCLEISLLSVSLGGREETRPKMELEAQPPSVGGSPVTLRSDSGGWVKEPVSTNSAAAEEEEEEEDEEEEFTSYLCRQKTH